MPIITPAYPSMCATHNVMASTQQIMTEEFKRGQQFCNVSAVPGNETRTCRLRNCRPSYGWRSSMVCTLCQTRLLFQIPLLSSSYCVIFRSRCPKQVVCRTGDCLAHPQLTTRFRSGTVESKIRQLVMRLEFVDALKLAHPFIKGFENVYYCLSEDETRAVSRGEIPEGVANRTKEDIAGKDGATTMYTTSFFVGLAIKPKEGTCRAVTRDLAFSVC